MAKLTPKKIAAKKTPSKKRAINYDEKLVVNASFLDIIKASAKDAKSKSASKKID